MDILPTLQTGTLTVVCAPHAAREAVSVVAAQLALRGSLTVLDAGNRFRPYQVARLLRRQTVDIDRAAKRLFIRRAFTCYQVLALLEGTPALQQPYLVLDLLSSFYDENVREYEARRLLEACLRQVERLSRQAPRLVTLAPPRIPERAALIEQVCARAGRVLVQEIPAPQIHQPALFAA
jgi:hypothetical protein